MFVISAGLRTEKWKNAMTAAAIPSAETADIAVIENAENIKNRLSLFFILKSSYF